MTELKTLKDMRHPDIRGEFVDREKIVSVVQLRVAAIIWIKDLDKDKRVVGRLDTAGAAVLWEHSEGVRNYKLAQIDWIKYFFGIGEEDLKEQ